MYQALYRKWRPRTFDDVVGQSHITDTLRRQVEAGRTSHAYLFTGTRGTGKTTCAKILSRAVNCRHPENGNPCNRCPACEGIENGSVLDVLELDAASNNGVEQIRALRDEAVYTPASVRKRVYIVDEVHMLSPSAFNALLKILEEPPEHLMFILATTELNKVPATIRSRCQQFAFQRIPAGEIAGRLVFVAEQEGIRLTRDGAELLSRLSDGGMRDALSLLDQCSGTQDTVDTDYILDTLGLAGAAETAKLMELIAAGGTADALELLGRSYAAGKDVSSVLGELSGLTRDLLLRRIAPSGAAGLLSGLFDEGTLRALGERFSTARLMQMLSLLQQAVAALSRSADRRTDAELCLLRLCSVSADDSPAALAARIERLEQRLDAQGAPAPKPALKPAPAQKKVEAPAPAEEKTPAAPAPEKAEAPVGDFWPQFCAELKGKIPPGNYTHLANPDLVSGVWNDGVLTLWVKEPFTKALLDRPAVTETLAKAALARFHTPARVVFSVGEAPAQTAPPQGDALDRLAEFGAKFDNIVIE